MTQPQDLKGLQDDLASAMHEVELWRADLPFRDTGATEEIQEKINSLQDRIGFLSRTIDSMLEPLPPGLESGLEGGVEVLSDPLPGASLGNTINTVELS